MQIVMTTLVPALVAHLQSAPPSRQQLIDKGYLTSSGEVVGNRLYYMFYMGDYDSAAWLYSEVGDFVASLSRSLTCTSTAPPSAIGLLAGYRSRKLAPGLGR